MSVYLYNNVLQAKNSNVFEAGPCGSVQAHKSKSKECCNVHCFHCLCVNEAGVTADFHLMHLALIYAAGLSFNAGVVSTLAKNEKTWVLRLCPSKLCFVISERGPVGGANIWCELSQVR